MSPRVLGGADRHSGRPVTGTKAREPRAPEWILCFGAGRGVDDGRLICPVRCAVVRVDACVDCRFVSATAEERDRAWDCLTP